MWRQAAAVSLLALAIPGPMARGAEPVGGSAAPVTCRLSLKASALLWSAREGELGTPADTGASSFWRLRVEPKARLGPRTTATLSYEHRLRVSSAAGAPVQLGTLPREATAPYRVRQLDWKLTATPASSWRHEIDRASVASDLSRLKLTVGRQAIGWGRGVLFGAVDLFSPFSPLEVDREWRRGVVAVRADIGITDRSSLDVVGAFGPRLSESVLAARFRGYAGKTDLEVVGGRRARDVFAGVTSSAAVGGTEVHFEAAFFRAPRQLAGSRPRGVAKVVAGASRRLGLGNGLVVHAEYHYSGFGAAEPGGIGPLLADPVFQARYLRGDTQILERHAVGVVGSYELSPELAVALQWFHAPEGRSGVVAPSATITLGDKLSILAAAHVPYGPFSKGAALRSEYGGGPVSGLVQVRIHE